MFVTFFYLVQIKLLQARDLNLGDEIMMINCYMFKLAFENLGYGD